MGTGWRRAFCTRDPESTISNSKHHQRGTSPSPSPRSCVRLGFLSGGGSNPSTPRLNNQQSTISHQAVSSPSLRCRTISEAAANIVNESPRLFQSKSISNSNTPRATKSPKISSTSSSNPTSPRSPLKLSLFRNSFKFRVSIYN